MKYPKVENKKYYFNEIVGLRIYLALWVALAHGLQLSGFLEPRNFFMKLILNGHAAVVVFMIVSGFVITNLLMTKRERYLPYIIRRFFRLYPAYVLSLVIGYFASGPWADIGQNATYRDVPGWVNYAGSLTELRHEVVSRFWPHALLHATMLHGLVPSEILPRAAMTFLPAAWSISLEWQFYLIAPIVLLMARTPFTLALLCAVGLCIFVLYTKGALGSYSIGSSIAGAAPYFAVGIASRLGYSQLSRLPFDPIAAIAVMVFLEVAILSDPLPFVVWSVFLSLSLWRTRRPAMSSAFAVGFMSRPALLLGEASYSLYLLHRPIQALLGDLAIHMMAINRIAMFGVQIAAIAVAIPLSVLSYTFVERLGVRIGSALANRLPSGPESEGRARVDITFPLIPPRTSPPKD